MVGRDVLKFGEVLARGRGVAFALVGARNSKFRGRVVGKKRQPLLVSSDGLIVLLQLRIQIADEIVGVGFVRKKFR